MGTITKDRTLIMSGKQMSARNGITQFQWYMSILGRAQAVGTKEVVTCTTLHGICSRMNLVFIRESQYQHYLRRRSWERVMRIPVVKRRHSLSARTVSVFLCTFHRIFNVYSVLCPLCFHIDMDHIELVIRYNVLPYNPEAQNPNSLDQSKTKVIGTIESGYPLYTLCDFDLNVCKYHLYTIYIYDLSVICHFCFQYTHSQCSLHINFE